MKPLNKYIQEKLVINKNYKNEHDYSPETKEELIKIISDLVIKQKGGTDKKPVDLNFIDVFNLDDLSYVFNVVNENVKKSNYKMHVIDISKWDVSNIKTFDSMFLDCKNIKYIGDLSNWDVSSAEHLGYMFDGCKRLKTIGDISEWDIENVTNFNAMFRNCETLEGIDIDSWESKLNNNLGPQKCRKMTNGTKLKAPKWSH